MPDRIVEVLEECLLLLDEEYEDLLEEIEDILVDLRKN